MSNFHPAIRHTLQDKFEDPVSSVSPHTGISEEMRDQENGVGLELRKYSGATGDDDIDNIYNKTCSLR